jgi:molybdate transport system substrate-binding protein
MLFVRTIFSGLILFLATFGGVRAETATVAVAANFLTTAKLLSEAFESKSGHQIVLVPGSTGKLYAQIVSGAPFDLFLSADAARPAALENGGLSARRKTYAIGQLVLLVRGRRETSLETLKSDSLRIAIADPDLAPYGAAARQVLGAVRGAGDWNANLVYGQDIGQTMSFIASRNADAALVALSLLPLVNFRAQVFLIPAELYDPIEQQVVLLSRSTSNIAAREFYDYLESPAAYRLIKAAGYGIPE